MPNILFVCSANRFRSVIAAEYFRMLVEQNKPPGTWVISSAGTWAKKGMAPTPQALRLAKTKELEIENVRSREVDQELLAEANLIVVMSEGQREALDLEFPQVKMKVYLLSEVCEGTSFDIPDPAEKLDETPEELCNEICNLVYNGFNNICLKGYQQAKHQHTSS
jgi:protein-tyrosine phosphatase